MLLERSFIGAMDVVDKVALDHSCRSNIRHGLKPIIARSDDCDRNDEDTDLSERLDNCCTLS
jgi:hypothetical protein